MIVGDPAESEAVDRVFRALADATRRDILGRASTGELSVSALARNYPMSVAAVQKHVLVLERADLVTKRRQGREQIVRVEKAALRRAYDALDGLEAIWRERVGQMDAILQTTTTET